jgi:zinc protease
MHSGGSKEGAVKNIIKSLLILSVLLVSCAGTEIVLQEEYPEGIQVKYLSNGIPVVMKASTTNRVAHLKLALIGQSQILERYVSGLEGMTLSMLTRGTEFRNYDQIQELLYRRTSGFGIGYTNFDYSTYSLNTLDKYFPELLDLYIEQFFNPDFSSTQFMIVKQDFLQARQQREQDPYNFASLTLNKKFFEGHPYVNDGDGSIEDLESITLDMVKEYYANELAADRMIFFASGNLDQEDLIMQLDASFGSLPRKGFVSINTKNQKAVSGLFLEDFPQSEGLAYVRGNFPLPDPSHPDAAALAIANSMLSDLLFEVVRTQNGAAYSVWSGEFAFKANYGNITVYKTSVPHLVKPMLDEAMSILAGGQCLSAQVSTSGEETSRDVDTVQYVSIDEALSFYKAEFVTEYYTDQQTNIAFADLMLNSFIHYGDPSAYQGLVDRIEQVSAEDISRVTQKYLLDQPKLWIVLGSKDLLDLVDESEFQ